MCEAALPVETGNLSAIVILFGAILRLEIVHICPYPCGFLIVKSIHAVADIMIGQAPDNILQFQQPG